MSSLGDFTPVRSVATYAQARLVEAQDSRRVGQMMDDVVEHTA